MTPMCRLRPARYPANYNSLVRNTLWPLLLVMLLTSSTTWAQRPFAMGFTPFPPDIGVEALDWTYDGIERHADLIAHHFDNGVPWQEALRREPYPQLVEDELTSRRARTPDGHAVYLALTPIASLRDGLAQYWGTSGTAPLPEPWSSRGFAHRKVFKAFFRHSLAQIERFEPDYMAYAVEVDLLARNDPAAYEAFKKLARKLYRRIKKKHPELPVFFTFTLGHPGQWQEIVAIIEPLLPYTDMLAVSTYPYLGAGIEGNVNRVPTNWFSRIRDLAPGKPIAVAETGYAAEDLILETLGVEIPGKRSWQRRYVEFLLSEMDALEAEFVVWFVLGDYDSLWEEAEAAGALELFKAWRDTGLYDEGLETRPSLRVWNRFLDREHVP